jgi:hypothetical protein
MHMQVPSSLEWHAVINSEHQLSRFDSITWHYDNQVEELLGHPSLRQRVKLSIFSERAESFEDIAKRSSVMLARMTRTVPPCRSQTRYRLRLMQDM